LVAKVAENKALPELKLLVRSKTEDAKVFASITKELKGKGNALHLTGLRKHKRY